MKQVPISVSKLTPKVDFFCELDNSPLLSEVEIRTEGVTWESFKANWVQTCPNIPGQRRLGLIRKTYINAIDPKEYESKRVLFAGAIDDDDDDDDDDELGEEDEAVLANFTARMSGCANNPTDKGRLPTTLPSSYQGRHTLFQFSNKQDIPSDFDFDKSTQENYAEESKEFYGPFKEFRASLDFDYHGKCSNHL